MAAQLYTHIRASTHTTVRYNITLSGNLDSNIRTVTTQSSSKVTSKNIKDTRETNIKESSDNPRDSLIILMSVFKLKTF